MKTTKFTIGFVLSMIALWFLFDSTRVTTGGHGLFSGMIHHQFHSSQFQTASMGLIFVPFLLGVVSLIYSSGKPWAWFLTWSGVGVIVIEMLSRIRFMMNVKSSYLILVMLMFAVGVGLMLKAKTVEDTNEQS